MINFILKELNKDLSHPQQSIRKLSKSVLDQISLESDLRFDDSIARALVEYLANKGRFLDSWAGLSNPLMFDVNSEICPYCDKTLRRFVFTFVDDLFPKREVCTCLKCDDVIDRPINLDGFIDIGTDFITSKGSFPKDSYYGVSMYYQVGYKGEIISIGSIKDFNTIVKPIPKFNFSFISIVVVWPWNYAIFKQKLS